MNILFVCSRNKWRSRTAETIYQSEQSHVVKSAGTEPSARIRISASHIRWADTIFVMEKHHRERLLEKFPDELIGKELVVLDIEDNYQYMDPELIEVIRSAVNAYLP